MLRLAARSDEACEAEGAAAAASVASGAQAAEAEGEAWARRLRPINRRWIRISSLLPRRSEKARNKRTLEHGDELVRDGALDDGGSLGASTATEEAYSRREATGEVGWEGGDGRDVTLDNVGGSSSSERGGTEGEHGEAAEHLVLGVW
jgi:hypothetical protein